MSTLKRLRSCGRVSVQAAGQVGLRTAAAAAGFSGLARCGSVWACPVCSAKIMAERARELSAVIDHFTDRGDTVGMVTLTMRHHKGDPLDECWDALSYAWSRVTGGKQWQAEKDAFGLVGWVRAVEVTEGDNGWHVHIHVPMFFHGQVDEEHVRGLADGMWARWERALGRKGFTALKNFAGGGGGLDVRVATRAQARIADYLTKAVYTTVPEAAADGLAAEATLGGLKRAKGGNRTPFQILGDFQRDGEVSDLLLWQEWERVSRGRRQLTWSRGLRDLVDLGEERTDEEIAEEDLGDEDVLVLPAETWRAVRYGQWELLDVAEAGGVEAAVAWLDARGLAWSWPVRSAAAGVVPERGV